MKLPPSPLRSRRSAASIAAVVAVVVYANSLGNGFALDDNPVIVENELVHDVSRLPEALSSPYWNNDSGRELGIWRPVTTALFVLEWELWGERAGPYHAVNTVVHGAATAVGTLLLAELVPMGAAFLAGLLFAVHPVHVEAVANVVGIAELLSAFLMFWACLIFLRRGRARTSTWTIVVLTGLYALAFLTKEHAAILPALFVLLDAWRERLRVRDLAAYLERRAALFTSLALAAAVILWLRLQVLGSVASPYPPLGADLLEEIPRIWTLPLVWAHYVRLLFFPVDLIPDYSPAVIDIQIGWNALNLAGVGLTLSFLVLAWVAWRGGGASAELGGARSSPGEEAVASAADRELNGPLPALTLGVLWFGVAVLPVANVFFLSGILLAERTLYTPSLGFALAAGAGLWQVRERWRLPALASAAVVVVLMAGRTWTATPVWADTMTLFNRFLDEHPEAGRAQWMLATHFWEDRDDPERALDIYRLAVGINGRSYPMMTEIIRRLLEMGAYRPAETLAGYIWREHPSLTTAPRLLALSLSRRGRHAEAVEVGREALESQPDDAILHHLVAIGYREGKAWEDALRHRKAVIANGEGDRWQQWRWMAELQLRLKDTAATRASLDSARARTADPRVVALLDSLRSEWSGPAGQPPDTAPPPIPPASDGPEEPPNGL